MADTHCTTCGQRMTACACPPPPLPNTLDRVHQLQQDRETVRHWLASVPQQHVPCVAAWVDAQQARARTADEDTIARLMDALGIGRTRQRRRKMTEAEFWAVYAALRTAWLADQGRYPTQTEAAVALGLSPRTLQRYLHPARGKKNDAKR